MTQTLYVIDFEGTRDIGIHEYGVVTLSNFQISGTKFVICDNGLQQKDLKYFTEIRQNGLFMAHNAYVEDRLLRYYFASPGYVKELSGIIGSRTGWGPWIDTRVLYKNFFRSLTDFSLKSLIEQFQLSTKLYSAASEFCDISCTGYHCAIFDALAASILLQNFMKITNENGLNLSISALIEYSKHSKMV